MKYLFKINFILLMHICLSRQNLFFILKQMLKFMNLLLYGVIL